MNGTLRRGLLPGVLLLLFLGVTFLLDPSGLPRVPVCWSREFLHIPCPACGLTRALLLIGHGRWEEAWSMNPFGFPVYAGVLLWGVSAWTSWRPRWMSDSRLFRQALWVPVAVALMWCVWLLRMM